MNILLTSASRKVWLVEAFRKAIAARGEVIAADITWRAAAMHKADRALLIPRSDSPGFVEEMITISQENDVGLLVPTRDGELSIFANAVSRFQEVGTRVHVPAVKALERCQDKRLFYDFCVDRGFPVLALLTDPSDTDLPLFVRPRFGSGSGGTHRIDTLSELETLSGRTDQFVVNRHVEAPEYTIDVFIAADGQAVSAVPRERVEIVAGESYVARTVDDAELVSSAKNLCWDLGLRGHNTVQAFRWTDGIAFIEVNPRFGGGAALSFAAGAPSPDWLVQETLGEPLEPTPGDYEPGLVMLRYTTDVYIEELLVQP